MPHIDANGTTLHYLDHPGGDGPPLVLLHGLAVSAEVWRPMLEFLPDRCAVALDARGHGGSARTSTNTFADHVADVVGVLEGLDAGPAVVVGKSLGAVVAVEVALTRPDLLAGAVAIATPGHLITIDENFRTASISMADGFAQDWIATARALVPGWFGRLGSDAVTEWATAQVARADPRCGDVVASLLDRDQRPQLPGLTVPTLYLAGEFDVIPPAIAAEHASLSPLAEVQVLPYAGHMPHIETPGLVAGIVSEFADRCAAAAVR